MHTISIIEQDDNLNKISNINDHSWDNIEIIEHKAKGRETHTLEITEHKEVLFIISLLSKV